MKKLCYIITFIGFSFSISAQERFTYNNETLDLKIEEEGKLDLLTLKLDKGYRYFIKDEKEKLYELINTKDENGFFLREYQEVLGRLIDNSDILISDIGYGRYSLKHFIKAYNSEDNRLYAYTEQKVNAQIRLSFFGGLTNHPFIDNSQNSIAPYFGTELEVSERKQLPRHAGYFNVFHAFNTSDLDYSSTQFSLGYRYRFINKESFNIYANLTFATYNFIKATSVINDVEEDITDSAFDAPFIFGIGTDIRVNNKNFITLMYNSIFAFFLDNEGNFPIDFALGYKFSL